MSIKISFNNFKPFNENYQTITKKPITLIYGPNSTGKSSLIDALLYYHNLRLASREEYGDEEYLNISNQYFAGDKLNLGNFESIVHKKDTERVISFETTYSENKEVFKQLIPDYSEYQEIVKTLDLSTKKEEESFDDFLTKLIESKEKDERGLDDSEEKSFDTNWYELLDKYDSLKNDILDRSLKEIIASRKEKESISLEHEMECLKAFIDYMIVIDSIRQLKIINKVGKDEKCLWSEIDFYIDGNILFSCHFSNRTQNYRIYLHKIIKPLVRIQEKLGKKIDINKDKIYTASIGKISKFGSKLTGNNSIVDFSNSIVENIFNPKYLYVIQYIGPLRLVPSQNDLFQKADDNNDLDYSLSLKQKAYERTEKMSKKTLETGRAFIRKFEKITYIFSNPLFKKISKLEKKYLKKMKHLLKQNGFFNILQFSIMFVFAILYILIVLLLLLPLVLLFLLFAILFLIGKVISFVVSIVFPSIVEKFILKIKYKFSNLFSKTNNFSSIGSVTSERMWSDFVGSKKMQKEIDRWLGNEKMKSHYKVSIDIVNPSWLQKIFGIGDRKRLSFLDTKTNTKVYPDEMGTGISQVLPILISSKMRKNSTIFIEQPELHLHPALQSELADEFIESAILRKNNFVIETHSEHLLLRFMKRMRQTAEETLEDESLKIIPDDIALLYVDTNGENTYILELELDADGTLLDQWPGGFFEEGFNERFL